MILLAHTTQIAQSGSLGISVLRVTPGMPSGTLRATGYLPHTAQVRLRVKTQRASSSDIGTTNVPLFSGRANCDAFSVSVIGLHEIIQV